MDLEKRAKLEQLQTEIYATIDNAWLFPESEGIGGFLGTGPIMIVAERPSTGTFGSKADRLLYSLLGEYGAADTHLTDVIKSRGRVDDAYPANLAPDKSFFDRELEIVQPKRIIAFGDKVHDMLKFMLAGHGIPVLKTWHYANGGRWPKRADIFIEQMRNACHLS